MYQDPGALEIIITRYCESIANQLRVLHDLLKYRHSTQTPPRDVATNLHSEAHRMSGAAHCMGFRELGNRLARIERKLKKTLSKRQSDIEETLKDIEFRLGEVFELLKDIRPENSRVLQLLQTARNSRDENSTAAPTFSEAAQLLHLRMLVADDDVFVRDLLTPTLESMGIRKIHAVASGLEVLHAINEFRPDIIVTDWKMDPISGFELLQCIRSGASPIRFDTPLIFFTGEEDRSFQQMALSNGADRFLRKPVSPDILRSSIINILNGGFSRKTA
ncbi:MAG: hypothetical protein CMK06_05215 [Ponticaulis sp.]|nr:hypothetical protein [Ponticaulis sp.]